MERKDFLKGVGLAGVGLTLPAGKILAGPSGTAGNCVLIPSETAGPFPLDLTDNSFYFRKDVTEGKAGAPLNLKMKIIGLDNCLPMQNLRVNIWHCDKDGLYSGYQTETGLTYLRGYQITDANGEVEFITIFPGWYNGRVCHIHFQVYVSSVYSAVSQLAFPTAEVNSLYATLPSLYTKGADPLTPATDGVFADGYAYQVATLTPNQSNGYDSYLEVTINGAGLAVGLAKLEPETGGQFKLRQNFPNPYAGETIIPFKLTNNSDVSIDLWDLTGRKVATITKSNLTAGEHAITINTNSLGIATGNYAFQLQVTNSNGTFRQCKMMTAVK